MIRKKIAQTSNYLKSALRRDLAGHGNKIAEFAWKLFFSAEVFSLNFTRGELKYKVRHCAAVAGRTRAANCSPSH
jgi:hypothetical protein